MWTLIHTKQIFELSDTYVGIFSEISLSVIELAQEES